MDPAERADANFVVHATWAVNHTTGMVSRLHDDLVLADSGLPCDTFNFICRARLDERRVRVAAGEAIAYFNGVGRPFSWWVGPADLPATLGSVLAELGLHSAESEAAMALALDRLPASVRPVPGLEVRRVRTAEDLATLARLSAANWSPPDMQVIEFYRRTAAAVLNPGSPQWFYLGILDGEPVATAEATVHGGTAGLYNISTVPPARGRGIGSVMTWQPLRDARSAGCDLGILQASADGVGIYRRLGFETYGDITEYKPA